MTITHQPYDATPTPHTQETGLDLAEALPRMPAGRTAGIAWGVEVLLADPALVGAKEPVLQETRDAVDARHHHVRGIVLLAHHAPFVRVAALGL